MSKDKQIYNLNTPVDEPKSRDIALAAVGKGANKKITKRKLERLGTIKAWSGFSKREDRIKRLKGQLKLDDELAGVISMDQCQKSNKNVN